MAHGTPVWVPREKSSGWADNPMKKVLGSPLGACPPPEVGGVVAAAVLQLAVVPPLLPAQLHFQGPLPVIAEAVPAVQRLFVGAAEKLAPFEEPHAPLTAAPAAFAVN